MKQLLNTLFVTSEDAYLTLDGENAVVKKGETEAARFPLHNLMSIYSFSYAGASPALMGACVNRNIGICFFSPRGKFLARAEGELNGNVVLRRTQYRVADDKTESTAIAKSFIFGKVYNARQCIERTVRDHELRIDADKLRSNSLSLQTYLKQILSAATLEELRGVEGKTATLYFDSFDEMILTDKENFFFNTRNRRPPLDNVNAMLSFSYSLLANDCASALEAAGLDSYVGFLHQDRSGRNSLALDLMEELRAPFADRFVLTAINNRVITDSDFTKSENGAVLLSENGRKTFLKAWQERKSDELTHPYLKEKMCRGMVPVIQALLLARYLRGDIDAYPPFLWK